MADDRRQTPVLSYATPVELDRSGVWREGRLVVKASGASLPPRCVRCNRPTQSAPRVNFRYYPPMQLVVSGAYRNIAVPLCDEHLAKVGRRRRNGIAMCAAGAALLGVGTLLAAQELLGGTATLGSVAGGILLLLAGDRVIRSRSGLLLVRATRTHLYFTGAGDNYLDSLGTRSPA